MREFIFGEDFNIYDEELIEKMYSKRICGIPLSFYLLDFNKTNTYCHLCSNMLTLVIPDSKRVTGNLPEIKGSDKGHSWVEKDDVVYDPAKGFVWYKPSFYERCNPQDVSIVPEEQVYSEISKYLKYTENQKEMYVAWVSNLEENLPHLIYRKYLKPHIASFKKEKKLDIKDYDEKLAQKYIQDLKEIDMRTQQFKKSESANQELDGFEH